MTLFDVAERPRPLSLVKLSGLIARAVHEVGLVEVEGEVHQPTRRPGRAWFTLRDRSCQISVTVPAKVAATARIAVGERVAVVGRLEHVPNYGRLQLVAEAVGPRGEGAIAAAIAEAREALRRDGVLDRPRRRLPVLPATVGVVCGADAAVKHDILSVVASRFPGYPVRFVEVGVSGLGAAASITDGLRRLDADPEVEVIVLARGGGDAAQLLPFSDEGLCRAIARCATPVVSAIGHEGDRPLCDDVADERCGTPSIAAALVVPAREELAARLADLRSGAAAGLGAASERAARRLASIDPAAALGTGADRAAARIDRAAARLELLHPRRRVAEARRRLARLDAATPVAARAGAAQATPAARRAEMDALDPARVLARGYAVVRDAGGAVVRDPAAAPAGAELVLQLAGGRLAARSEGAA